METFLKFCAPVLLSISPQFGLAQDTPNAADVANCVKHISLDGSLTSRHMIILEKELHKRSNDSLRIATMAAHVFASKAGCKEGTLKHSPQVNEGSCEELAKHAPSSCLFFSNLGAFSTQETYHEAISVFWFPLD